jgi:putative aldouronate transport system permease protein
MTGRFNKTLQYLILKLLQTSSAADQLSSTAALSNPAVSELLSKAQGQGLVTSQTIELASMVIASIPMIGMYPFAQRFFIKGVLLGSVKG